MSREDAVTIIELMDGSAFRAAPCPHCGSSNLRHSLWCDDDGEVDAVECDDCLSGGPMRSWNKRWIPMAEEAAPCS